MERNNSEEFKLSPAQARNAIWVLRWLFNEYNRDYDSPPKKQRWAFTYEITRELEMGNWMGISLRDQDIKISIQKLVQLKLVDMSQSGKDKTSYRINERGVEFYNKNKIILMGLFS